MFRALNELKSDIVVEKHLATTTSAANYSKSAHRIKNAHMQNMSHDSFKLSNLQSFATRSKKSVTITAKMDANTNSLQVNRNWKVYIDRYIIHWSDPRLLPRTPLTYIYKDSAGPTSCFVLKSHDSMMCTCASSDLMWLSPYMHRKALLHHQTFYIYIKTWSMFTFNCSKMTKWIYHSESRFETYTDISAMSVVV